MLKEQHEQIELINNTIYNAGRKTNKNNLREA